MKSTCLLPLAFLFFLAACGPADEKPDGNSNTTNGDTVVLSDPEVNGSSVTCSRVYEVDASGWPPKGYPMGASGTYRYVSDYRYDGPQDGMMPTGGPTGFYLSREEREDTVWTLMSTKGLDASDEGYPWDHHSHGQDCPDGNATWVNGALVKAR